jgi:transcriptional regulator with XRE-family HTH domain
MLNNFYEIIREKRKKMGLSIKKLSEKSGVSVGTISRYENGQVDIGVENLISICGILQLSIGMGGSDQGGTPLPQAGQGTGDPTIDKIVIMLKEMDEETRKDICLSVEKEKLLRDLLKQANDKDKKRANGNSG